MQRRKFLQLSALTALQLGLLGQRDCRQRAPKPRALVPAGDLLDLPPGFSYQVLQRAGQTMSDGFLVPLQPDGMCCVDGGDGHWILLRNHEIGAPGQFERYNMRTSWVPDGKPAPTPMYDAAMFGGVSRVILDTKKLKNELRSGRADALSTALTSSNMALGGTEYNCSGGRVPQGWVSCEETDRAGHGWAFLVQPDDSTLTLPRKITSWGRFKREGIALDTTTGITYMSEDDNTGCLYRHRPSDARQPMGAGRLEALALVGTKTPSTGAQKGQRWSASWVGVPDPAATQQPCRTQAVDLGATSFARTEGILWDGQAVWFVCTAGGPLAAGQIFRYEPSTQTVTLVEQVTDRSVLSMPDNCALTPWGDLLLAEDNYNAGDGCTHQYMRLLTRDGRILDLARNRDNVIPNYGAPGSEFTGPCFSPDGTVLFANLQSPKNLTVAITGPWTSLTR